MSLFAMIHTKVAGAFTGLAVRSFFGKKSLQAGDRFILLDNDGSFVFDGIPEYPIEVLKNERPQGFSANANRLVERALEEKRDLYLLNNDLIFSEGWSDPLRIEQPVILSPLTNREVQYHTQTKLVSDGSMKSEFKMRMVMEVAEYENHEREFDAVAEIHRRQGGGLLNVLILPYCCVKLPHMVMERIGYFDESFGQGGGEDYDYSMRASLAGFHTAYALGSLVLHFGGQSSWASGEPRAETEKREAHFKEAFRRKWGEKLYQLVVLENDRIIQESKTVQEHISGRNMRGIIEELLGDLRPDIRIER